MGFRPLLVCILRSPSLVLYYFKRLMFLTYIVQQVLVNLLPTKFFGKTRYRSSSLTSFCGVIKQNRIHTLKYTFVRIIFSTFFLNTCISLILDFKKEYQRVLLLVSNILKLRYFLENQYACICT